MNHRMGSGVATAFLCMAFSVAAQERPLIVVDPGHGGDEVGVRVEDLLEKDVTLQAGFALGESLVRSGYDVRLTRTGDVTVPLDTRRQLAVDAGAAALVSLHFNGDEDPSLHGIEIYGNLDDARVSTFADRVADALRGMGAPVVVEARPWGFLESDALPIIMIEAGFMTHPVERRLVTTSEYHHALAEAIVEGIRAYLVASTR